MIQCVANENPRNLLRLSTTFRLQRVLHAILTSRLLLNIHTAAHEDKAQWMPTNPERFMDADIPGFDIHLEPSLIV